MGEKDKFDLNSSNNKNFTFMEAMNYASSYDYIALQYKESFDNIINNLAPKWREYFKNFNSDENATTALFLDLISVVPDSLIARKYGIDKAKEVSSKFLELSKEYSCSKNPNSLNNQLLLMDSELKIQGLNPGTTADVVVASIFLNRLGL